MKPKHLYIRFYQTIILLLLFVLFNGSSPPNPPPGYGDPNHHEPAGLDDGIFWLTIAAGVYGLIRIVKKEKKSSGV